ncbi:hypothetical protein [Nonomuraea turkmeniaca]|uniref:hypothetical protein n=1 Tax=Nonomuraea turkmeniaca TaxID=103838 RepID=UPI001B882B61|nr:hypothetical protein [Nonomuraea turkmeniaca]
MSPEKVHFTEEKATLLATLYGRALDARSPRPILGDEPAAEVIERIDHDFSKTGITARTAPAVALRARFMDRWAAEFLHAHPDAMNRLGLRLQKLNKPVQRAGATLHWAIEGPAELARECRRRVRPSVDAPPHRGPDRQGPAGDEAGGGVLPAGILRRAAVVPAVQGGLHGLRGLVGVFLGTGPGIHLVHVSHLVSRARSKVDFGFRSRIRPGLISSVRVTDQ